MSKVENSAPRNVPAAGHAANKVENHSCKPNRRLGFEKNLLNSLMALTRTAQAEPLASVEAATGHRANFDLGEEAIESFCSGF